MKTRDIPLCDLYFKLQMEWIGYKTRSLTYKHPYNEKYEKVFCDGKRKKIEAISLKNGLPSIFSNKNLMKKYMSKFFNEWGLPNFDYRDEKCEQMMSGYDKRYYFAVNSTVKVKLPDKEVLGEIIHNNTSKEILRVRIPDSDTTLEVDYSLSKRIFKSDFEDRFC